MRKQYRLTGKVFSKLSRYDKRIKHLLFPGDTLILWDKAGDYYRFVPQCNQMVVISLTDAEMNDLQELS